MKKTILVASSIALLLAFALSMYLLNGCKKNVEPIKLVPKINVSSYVFNSETYVGIIDVEIAVDGNVATTTNSDGAFTITGLKPGTYLISATKEGFTKGKYELIVHTEGAKLPQFDLKQLSPPVIIGTSGGIAQAVKSSGEQAAELIIPPGELTSDKKVSATNLVGNEVPKILESSNKLLGTTISLTSDDKNIQFVNGAQLTFRLPFLHKPGDSVEVTHFNETTNEWEILDNAIVNTDGLSATVMIHHFSTYSVNINGNYSEEPDVSVGYEIVGNSENYNSVYKWNSTLEYREGVPDGIDKEWLYKTVENQTKLNFSKVTYSGETKSAKYVITPAIISSTVSPPPIGNPVEYSYLPKRPWELVVQCCWVHEIVDAEIWIAENNGYIVIQVPNWYLVCSLFWIWRHADTDPIPSACYNYYYSSPPIVIKIPSHQGGFGN